MRKILLILSTVIIIIFSIYFIWFIPNYSQIKRDSKKDIVEKIQPSLVETKIASMTLRQKISCLLILQSSNTEDLIQFLSDYQPSGLIFMQENINSKTSIEIGEITKSLQNNPDFPYLFAIDQEGGTVKRLSEDTFASAYDLKNQTTEATRSAFYNRSMILKKAGLNLNFGIIADVTEDTSSFIYPRVFGGDPYDVAEKVSGAIDGEKNNVLSTLKHYPGHGETTADSHYQLPETDISYKDWQTKDEIPFISGIRNGAQFIMFGHLIYSSIDSEPASLSKTWHEILRERDKFKGIIITDDMAMLQQSGDINYRDPVKNAVKAINVGNTMLLYILGSNDITTNNLIDGIVNAVNEGEIEINLIDTNVKQILELRNSLSSIITK